MTRIRLAVLVAALSISAAVFHAQAPPAEQAFTFTQIVPGIYSALGTGTMNVGSNSAVIVDQDDVVIVDSHISPESGRAMLAELKTISDKPVKFLINTHFHYDHTNGNQVFPPAVDIIGHEYTRRRLTGDILQKGMFANLLAALPQQLDTLRTRASVEQDPAAKARLESQLRVQTAFAKSVKEVTPTPPNVTPGSESCPISATRPWRSRTASMPMRATPCSSMRTASLERSVTSSASHECLSQR